MNDIDELSPASPAVDPEDYATVDVAVIRAHTGRKVDIDHSDEPEYAAVQTLAPLNCAQIEVSEVGARIVKDLQGPLPIANLEGRVFFRGRPSAEVSGGWEAMGPPPPACAREGRYNQDGVSVLYLASTIDGVRRELRPEKLCIQEYVLDGLRVADLTDQALTARLKAAFELAEQARVEGRPGPTTFALPHFLARTISNAGYEGFLVPGVRGCVSAHYENAVILVPEPRWRHWSRRESGIRRDP